MSKALRFAFLMLLGLYFLIPMLAMARFAFQAVPTALLTWDNLFSGWSIQPLMNAVSDPRIIDASRVSALLAVFSILVNLVILVPLAIVAEVRAPRLKPLLTAATLLPWVVPPIALVVGVAGTFRSAAPWFLASVYSLVPFYALWALPFTYRALEAGLRGMNARTLYEAAKSLGAPLRVIIFKVVLPNMRASIIAAAALTTAMVLGEFAFASLLLKQTLPTMLVVYQGGDPRGGLALSLAVMVLTALAISVVVVTLKRRGLHVQTTGI